MGHGATRLSDPPRWHWGPRRCAETEFCSLKKKKKEKEKEKRNLGKRVRFRWCSLTPGPWRRTGCPSLSEPSLSQPGDPKRSPQTRAARREGTLDGWSLLWEIWRPRRCIPSAGWLPFTADSQVPRRNFALHMRRSWLVYRRGWKGRPPGSALGMAWGSAGKRRPTISPIHAGRGERPGLHLQPQTGQPLLGPRASRALPPPPALPPLLLPHGSGRVLRARQCNPTLHPRPGARPLGPRARLPAPATPQVREMAC